MGRKQDIDEKLLAEKILEFEASSEDMGGLSWDRVSSEVFPQKKKKPMWLWYGGVAAALMIGLLFVLPEDKDKLADVKQIENTNSASKLSFASDETTELVESSSAVAEHTNSPQAKRLPQLPAVLPESRSLSMVKTRESKAGPVTGSLISTEKVDEKMALKEAVESPSESGVLEVKVAATEPVKVQNQAHEEEFNQVEKEQIASEASSGLQGKKVLLVIETQPLEGDNEKKGIFKRIGKFNRTGEWEKNEKQADMWARFMESTKPEKRAAQL